MDYQRLKSLLVAPDGTPREPPASTIRRLLAERQCSSPLRGALSVKEAFGYLFPSYLFNLGLVTIGSEEFGTTHFVIPNYVIEQMHFETLRQLLIDLPHVTVDLGTLHAALGTMTRDGDIIPFLERIYHQVIRRLSNRDLIHTSEKNMKFILLAWLSMNDIFYPFSEMELIGGYSDLILSCRGHQRELRQRGNAASLSGQFRTPAGQSCPVTPQCFRSRGTFPFIFADLVSLYIWHGHCHGAK